MLPKYLFITSKIDFGCKYSLSLICLRVVFVLAPNPMRNWTQGALSIQLTLSKICKQLQMVQKCPGNVSRNSGNTLNFRNANHSSENSGKRPHGMITYDCKKDRIVRFLIALTKLTDRSWKVTYKKDDCNTICW